jgi:hypothetical protein
MAIRYPIEYSLSPRQVDAGMRWIRMVLKNVGDDELTSLDVKLNSFDTYSLDVEGTGLFVGALGPAEEVTHAFQVSARLTDRMYISLDGYRDGERFHWESPGIRVVVGDAAAELVSLFAMTRPYPPPGKAIRCEATVKGLRPSKDLVLESWVRAPSDRFEFRTLELGSIAAGEELKPAFEVVPEEEGSYTVYAYLYDGYERIGHESDQIYVIRP